MPEPITSLQNPKVKAVVALQGSSRLRRETGLFVVEGRRELERCLAAGYEVESVFVCQEIAGDGAFPVGTVVARDLVNGRGPDLTGLRRKLVFERRPGGDGRDSAERVVPTGNDTVPAYTTVFQVSRAVYDKIAYRGGTEGVVATVRCREHRLEDLSLSEQPLIVVLESVEKPGNLGAVLRSADAAGADAVLVCDPLTDLFNPNLIRASLGAFFSVPTVAVPSAEAIAWLKERGIRILTAQLQDSELYYNMDMRGGTALVMGTEATGLTAPWRQAADAHIRIPMLGTVDSLNVSVSTAILLFEAVRQRRG